MGDMVTANQVEWIFDRSRDFMKCWVESPPTSEKEWQLLMEQAHDLMRRGRDHPLLMGIMVQVLGCIISQDKTQQTEDGASRESKR